jgi:hypothetical protein
MDQPYDTSTQLTPNSINYLRSMAGWIKFISIFYIVVISVAMIFMMVVSVASLVYGGFPAILAMLLYLAILGSILWICVVFLRSANGFARFVRSGQPIDLETAVRAQKKGWMVIGVLYILLLVFILILFIVMMGLGVGSLFYI